MERRKQTEIEEKNRNHILQGSAELSKAVGFGKIFKVRVSNLDKIFLT